jgi:phosphoribosylformylglycinamidine synthase
MATVNALVLRAPGTNCDLEACYALELARAKPTRVHVNALLESPATLDEYQILLIPGGFSYGDDVAAGKVFANQLRLRLGDHLRRFRDSGKLTLGICNGFQVLVKAGLLPGWNDSGSDSQDTTLANNDSGKFEDRWIHMLARPGRCVLLQGIERLDLPIAHGEGKFVCRDASVFERLNSSGQIVLTYTERQSSIHSPQSANRDPQIRLPYPVNPNGSQANVAGICDPTGRILGLMPHPERHVESTQHPQWTRRTRNVEADGLALFRNAVRYLS